MQVFIAKYGLAAHLALLAVAPLFLWPFADTHAIAIVLLWLSVPAFLWTLFEPSVRGGEGTRGARHRVWRSVVSDPLFWASLLLVIVTGVRALNTGVALAYDAEKSVWRVSEAIFPILPSSVKEAGFLPFAVSVALTVVLQGCRHSLGRSARLAFLLSVSFFAGLSALIIFFGHLMGNDALAAFFQLENARFSFVGFSYGLCLLGGTVGLIAAFEHDWRIAMLLVVIAIAGCAAGLFACSPIIVSAAFLVAEIVIVGYGFAYSRRALRSSAEFKMIVFWSIALVLGGLLVMVSVPDALVNERIKAYQELAFFPEGFWTTRTSLSAMALKTWLEHLWLGTGIDSFAYDFRFLAEQNDWVLMPRGASALANGWWLLLCERGIVGMCLFLLPYGFLLFTYIRRLCIGVQVHEFPHPAILLAPLALMLLVAEGFFGCSLMRAEVVLTMCATLAVSAAAFPKRKRR